MKEKMKASGFYKITGRRDGQIIYNKSFENVVSQLYFDALYSLMDSTETTTGDELKINVLATGTGTAISTKQDTQLTSESFRKSVTTVRRTATTVQILTDLLPDESNFTISEVGVFAGGVVGTPNSGTLISHRTINPIIKTANDQYTISYTFTIE